MTNKTLAALIIVSTLVTGCVNASFTVINHGSTQPVKIDFDYTQNNNSQTVHLEVGPHTTIVWDAPGQGQACITALRVNDMPRGLYTMQNMPSYNPSCMQSANIHIWPAGNVTVDGVTVRNGQMVPR